ncbi:MAG: RecQ family ATP-dependent DNA helicase [Chitinophagales bacterium]|nr:RecQ family ATP-dependent DNA helicase [Chitinophagales bacterium]
MELNTPSSILKKYWGYDSFRPLQGAIVQSVLDKKDTVVLLPTGGGKSLCFQVPALLMNGVCIVISPLIALMKDQVENLQKRGIKAAYINSEHSSTKQIEILDNCEFGGVKLLYIAPERIQSEAFQLRIRQLDISLIAIDEAHCISQWGYDFRPSYLKINTIREICPTVPIIALTASATNEVLKDIQVRLDLKTPAIFKGSFARPNLVYVNRETETKKEAILEIIKRVSGSGIVYVRNRKETQNLAFWLREQGISADHYHAGLSMSDRKTKQDAWTNNKTRIIVSTNAFGMGIDKPDVRTVIHFAPPDSIEAYYQEAGRGGRDGQKAFAVLLYEKHDIAQLEKKKQTDIPNSNDVKQIYNSLLGSHQIAINGGAGTQFEFDLSKFCKVNNLSFNKVISTLKILEYHELISYNESTIERPKVQIIVSNETLTRFMQNNKKVEPLVKLMLRTSPGIFEQPININEHLLGQKLQLSKADFDRQMSFLKNSSIIFYSKSDETPIIKLLKDRLAMDDMGLDADFIHKRGNAMIERIEAINNYVLQKTLCRSVVIASYFGEKFENVCGVCDVCLANKKSEKIDFDALYTQLTDLLQTPKKITEIADALKTSTLVANQLLEWGLSMNKIIKTEDGNYYNV